MGKQGTPTMGGVLIVFATAIAVLVTTSADTLPAIIEEMLLTKVSERQGRVIDFDTSASMEKKKQEGYF